MFNLFLEQLFFLNSNVFNVDFQEVSFLGLVFLYCLGHVFWLHFLELSTKLGINFTPMKIHLHDVCLICICSWLVRGSLFIELGCPGDLGKGWRGDLGTFMIRRPI